MYHMTVFDDDGKKLYDSPIEATSDEEAKEKRDSLAERTPSSGCTVPHLSQDRSLNCFPQPQRKTCLTTLCPGRMMLFWGGFC